MKRCRLLFYLLKKRFNFEKTLVQAIFGNWNVFTELSKGFSGLKKEAFTSDPFPFWNLPTLVQTGLSRSKDLELFKFRQKLSFQSYLNCQKIEVEKYEVFLALTLAAYSFANYIFRQIQTMRHDWVILKNLSKFRSIKIKKYW